MSTQITAEEIQQAVTLGARRYFEQCRTRVPRFIDQNFRYPGAWKTNKVALGLDLLRAPINLFWAPIYAICTVLGDISRRLSWLAIANCLCRVPTGLTTRVQQHISLLITRDLLGAASDTTLLESEVAQALEELYRRPDNNTTPGSDANLRDRLKPVLDDALAQYTVTRTASADITNTVACTVLGAFAWQKFTPGGIGIGVAVAMIWAREQAAGSFILGEFLGDLYYRLFPPEPSLLQISGSIAGVLAVLAALASLSGLLTDPLQSATGLHRRRLNRLINDLQCDFETESAGSFRPRDQYVARILEVFDLVKAGA